MPRSSRRTVTRPCRPEMEIVRLDCWAYTRWSWKALTAANRPVVRTNKSIFLKKIFISSPSMGDLIAKAGMLPHRKRAVDSYVAGVIWNSELVRRKAGSGAANYRQTRLQRLQIIEKGS